LYAAQRLIGTVQQNTEFIAQLCADVLRYQAMGHVMLVGDFNAWIGDLRDADDSLRRCVISRTNNLGVLLMDMIRRLGMKTTTGRLDMGQPTYISGRRKSRIDHAFIDAAAWQRVRAWCINSDHFDSDHAPLSFGLDVVPASAVAQQAPLRLRWDYRMQQQYTTSVLQHPLLTSVDAALAALDVAQASTLFKQIMRDCASSCGMVKGAVHVPTRLPVLPLSPEAKQLKLHMQAYRRAGIPISQDMRAQWRTYVRTARKLREEQQQSRVHSHLRATPRLFWSQYRKRYGSADGVLPTEAWMQFFADRFGNAACGDDIAGATSLIDAACPLMCPVTVGEVQDAFRKLGTNKAVGADGIPAEFVTKLHIPDCDVVVTHNIMVAMCNAVLATGCMPQEWKVKTITPVFKHGDRLSAAQYRPIAVASTFYRIFTAVFSARLTKFLHEHRPDLLLDSQFGFRAGLSVEHAHFALLTCCQSALAHGRQLAIVKLDIAKAYDTVVRQLMWSRMRSLGMPSTFVQLMQQLYHSAPYVVKVNGQISAQFVSEVGLQQGCAMSPPAYNMYLRDALHAIEQKCRAVGVQWYSWPCVQVNYADDITGTVAVGKVGTFLDIVESVLAPINQTLGREKCKILIVSRQRAEFSHLHGVPVVHQMKVLGLVYTHNLSMGGNLQARLSKGAGKNILHYARLQRCGCLQDVHVARLMVNADVRPTLLFGACIWGHAYLSYTDPMKHKLQTPYSVLQRVMLGQGHGTSHWAVALLTGHFPIQHHIILEFCRFFNRLLVARTSNSVLMSSCLTQLRMFRDGKQCWMKAWCTALQRLLPQYALLPTIVRCFQQVDEQRVQDALIAGYHNVLRGMGNPFELQCAHRRIAMSYYLVGQHTVASQWGRVPVYMRWPLPHVVNQVWRAFMCAALDVPVHEYNLAHLHWSRRCCRKCIAQCVADEQHVLLHCASTQHVRAQFNARLLWPVGTLAQFVQVNNVRDLPFFVYAAWRAYKTAPVVATAHGRRPTTLLDLETLFE
jgi:hypothetical protein